MMQDGLQAAPPPLGEMNNIVYITDKAIASSQNLNEQYFKNIQAKMTWAAIRKPQPFKNSNYENQVNKDLNDAGIWTRLEVGFMPQVGMTIYHPYRMQGLSIDYVYKVNEIGQKFFHMGLIYYKCRTDIINDARLKPLEKLSPLVGMR
jgi:hypothetical protein